MRYSCLFVLCLLLSPIAAPRVRADNSPERALRDFKTYVLPKISYACASDFSAEYDGESMREHDEYIAHDQSSGDDECNEPFRYLWFVCQTAPGIHAVKKAGVKGVLCKGTSAAQSTLSLSNGILVIERAAKEEEPYVRLRKRFEELLKVQVVFAGRSSPNPRHDQTFSDLTGQPNPSLSKTDYCVVNNERLELQPLSKLERTRDGQIKCWKEGKLITSLTVKEGRRTGLATEERGSNGTEVSHYKDGRLHGEQRETRAGKLVSLTSYENGQRVWWQQNESNGLVSYTHQYADGRASVDMTGDGKVYSLHCTPTARDDKALSVVCGFDAPRTTRIYDGTNKVSRIETWHNGELMERKAGDSDYAARSEVAFKAGKKHGRERLTRADGTAEIDIEWTHGVKDGREIHYDETGKKKVSEIVWKAGDRVSTAEFYLNGQRRSLQQVDGDRGVDQRFWDNGKLQSDAKLTACNGHIYQPIRGFCEHGVKSSFHEDGSKQEETHYNKGKRHGESRTFWPNGKPSAIEHYADDVLQKAKRWDESGKLVVDEEYEADGSRKSRRI
jgi:antitoxin component YwqK of YwqJK toxin-antitoxin module